MDFRWFKFTLELKFTLNHLTTPCAATFNWPFRTLSFGIFVSNLNTKDFKTLSRIYFGHF